MIPTRGAGVPAFKGVPSCKLLPVSRTHHPAPLQRRQPTRVVLWAGLLVLALLWTQSLGLWHRLVHFDTGQTAKLALVQAAASDAPPALSAPYSPSGKLFSNHQTDTDCQLFDQLSHADGVTALLASAPALLVSPQFLRVSHGLAVARWHALFQARGPPSLR